MKKKYFAFLLIIVSVVLIILNSLLTSDQMDLGFWLRNAALAILIVAMGISIRDMKKK